MKLNEANELVEPPVGDAELVRLDFDSANIDVHIRLSGSDGVVFVLRIVGARWFSFSTNHSQNVIDRIVITRDLAAAVALAPQDIREQIWIREQGVPGQGSRPAPLTALHIWPISGPKLTCIADDVKEVIG